MSIFRRERPVEDPREGERFHELVGELNKVVASEVLYGPKGPLSLDQRRERLDELMNEFARYHDLARGAAQDYLAEHVAVIEALAADRAKVEAHLQNLDKIAAGMPQFGGKDEKTPSNPNPNPDNNPGTGEKQSGGEDKLLNYHRRQKPLSPGTPSI